jgi:putative ABC transport system permease protein
VNVANKPVVRRLTVRALKANQIRNVIAIIAIALTAVLFTGVFTIGGSIVDAVQEQTMRQVGTQSHGGLKALTEAQYAHFAQSPLIKDISYNIIVGIAENEAFKKESAEIRYSEDKMAEWWFSYPGVGNMPQAENELACSTIVLDALGVSHELGSNVSIEFKIDDKLYSKTFSLCGYWGGDNVANAQQIWLSKDYVDSLFAGKTTTKDGISGRINADVWFSNYFNIEEKMRELLSECGYAEDEISAGANRAYVASKVDPAMIVLLVFVLSLILLSGYLIIYSIFAISVNADIRFYGLLKTIGTTGRQIRRIVRGQALILSAIGIPIGLVVGHIVGLYAVPIALSVTAITVNVSPYGTNPAVLAFAALFSFLTVFISCRKPGKLAAKVSPVEAVRYCGQNSGSKRKAKRTGVVTPMAFAWANITREKKKLCVIVLSLSLSMLLLNSAFSAAKSFDMDQYLAESIVCDFAISDRSLAGVGVEKNLAGVSSAFLREAENHGGEIHNIYYAEYVNPVGSGDVVSYNGGIMTQQVYGIDKALLEEILDMDYDKFSSGAYAIVSKEVVEDPSIASANVPNVGDSITLRNENGDTKIFEVLALIEAYPYSMSARYWFDNSLEIVVADSQFKGFFGLRQPMQTNIAVDETGLRGFEEWLDHYTTNIDADLSYTSRSLLEAEFGGLQRTYTVLGSSLAFIFALIGVLNFANAMVTSIFARRREFAMLQSVGMTGAQLRKTLMLEGGGFTVMTALFTMTIGFALTYAMTHLVAGQVWFFKQSATLLPSAVCLPVLLVLCAAISVFSYTKLTRESLVQRLRLE